MHRHWTLALALVALGCEPATGTIGEIEDTGSGDQPGDDDDDAPGDDDDDQPGDDDDDDDLPEGDWFLSGQLDLPADAEPFSGPLTVVLFNSRQEACCAPWVQRDVGVAAPGDSVPFVLGLPDMPEDPWFLPLDNAPDLEVAAFSIGAYIDEDGDGIPTAADTFVASELRAVAYARGEVPEHLEAQGWTEGWHELQLHTAYPEVQAFEGDRTLSATAANLLPLTPPSPLTATVRNVLSEGGGGTRRVQLFAFASITGLPVADPVLATEAVVEPGLPDQVVTFPHPLPTPPADHYVDALGEADPLPDAEAAFYYAFAFADTNEDGLWTFPGEPLLADMSGPPEEEQVTLLRTRATGFQARLVAHTFGHMGWTLIRPMTDEDGLPVTVPWGDGLVLDAP